MSMCLLRSQLNLVTAVSSASMLLKLYRDQLVRDDEHLRKVLNTIINDLEIALVQFGKDDSE